MSTEIHGPSSTDYVTYDVVATFREDGARAVVLRGASLEDAFEWMRDVDGHDGFEMLYSRCEMVARTPVSREMPVTRFVVCPECDRAFDLAWQAGEWSAGHDCEVSS